MGFVPFWAKDKKIGYKMINARAETLDQKPAFKRSFKRRRCLIPADSFYEWKKSERGKTPIRIRLKSSEFFAFAGLWDRWRRMEKKFIPVRLLQQSQIG
jgi:putative SOS response-associated peptidase YedK